MDNARWVVGGRLMRAIVWTRRGFFTTDTRFVTGEKLPDLSHGSFVKFAHRPQLRREQILQALCIF